MTESSDKRLVDVAGAKASLRDWQGPLKWGADGLIAAVVVDAAGRLLMQAYMNQAALQRTLETGETWFWSRSRQALWHKGETSGHFQRVRHILVDCDGDALRICVDQVGAACHEGDYSCFHYRLPGAPAPAADAAGNGDVVGEVEAVLQDRKANPDPESYTSKLFARGADAYLKKVGEEATEVVLAVKNGDRENLVFEVADLWFHSLIALVDAGLSSADVARQLASRRGKRRQEAAK